MPKHRDQKFRSFTISAEDELLIRQLSSAHAAVLNAPGGYTEKAEALGLPPGTIKSRLHRARAALQALRNARGE